jgi:hypothetical protein
MSEPTNIQCFECAAAGILARLFEEFPRPLAIVSMSMEADMVKALLLPEACQWPERPSAPGACLVGATVAWLAEEGLVRVGSQSGSKFSGVVLTARGFAALNSPMLPETDGKTVGKALLGFVKDSVASGCSAAIGSVVQYSLGGLGR